MSDNVMAVSDDIFETEVVNADIPVLVDFWAEWCGPCRMFAPILHEVADDYVGKVKFVKANVDENQGSAQKYGVRGIPTIILFKDGEAVETQVGALSKTQLIEFIDKNI